MEKVGEAKNIEKVMLSQLQGKKNLKQLKIL
jgi:hypothetical protein